MTSYIKGAEGPTINIFTKPGKGEPKDMRHMKLTKQGRVEGEILIFEMVDGGGKSLHEVIQNPF